MSGNPPHLYEERPFRTNTAIRDLFEGRSNAVGAVTLRANETTTVVEAITVAPDTKVFLMPTTANAAADFASCYISAVVQGQFTVTHPSDADTDKTFFWVGLG